jgi:hypothetical protein
VVEACEIYETARQGVWWKPAKSSRQQDRGCGENSQDCRNIRDSKTGGRVKTRKTAESTRQQDRGGVKIRKTAEYTRKQAE